MWSLNSYEPDIKSTSVFQLNRSIFMNQRNLAVFCRPALEIFNQVFQTSFVLQRYILEELRLERQFVISVPLTFKDGHRLVVLLQELVRGGHVLSVSQLDVVGLQLHEFLLHLLEHEVPDVRDLRRAKSNQLLRSHYDLILDQTLLEVLLLPNVELNVVVWVLNFLLVFLWAVFVGVDYLVYYLVWSFWG